MRNILFFWIAALALIVCGLIACDIDTDKTVVGIAIIKKPAKTAYTIGDIIDLAGLEVAEVYSNGSKKVISDYAVSSTEGFTAYPGGTKIITVSHEDKSVDFSIWVYTDDGMIWIPAGNFIIGNSSPDVAPAACISPYPQRQVIFTNGFFMGRYEITQALYEEVMGVNPSFNNVGNTADFPVERVSWYNAVEFCNKLSVLKGLEPAYIIDKENPDPNNTLNDPFDPKWTVTLIPEADGYRLPTEAQWEYACRAGTTTLFNTGDNIKTNQANYNGNPFIQGEPPGLNRGGSIAVGSFAPNNWGLYDMHGNVWEWCWDFINDGGDNYYFSAPNPDTDPHGLTSGNRRVERGGAWNSPPNRILSAYRERARPYRVDLSDVGFRVVRP